MEILILLLTLEMAWKYTERKEKTNIQKYTDQQQK